MGRGHAAAHRSPRSRSGASGRTFDRGYHCASTRSRSLRSCRVPRPRRNLGAARRAIAQAVHVPQASAVRASGLRALRPLQGSSPYVFTTEAGTPVTPAWFLRMTQRTGEAARLPFLVHPHMLAAFNGLQARQPRRGYSVACALSRSSQSAIDGEIYGLGSWSVRWLLEGLNVQFMSEWRHFWHG